MRAAAESTSPPRRRSSRGSRRGDGSGADSIDLATAGQAFHWFAGAHRAELRASLRPGAHVALIWNVRASTPFNGRYEDLLVRFAPEYRRSGRAIAHRRRPERGAGPAGSPRRRASQPQQFDRRVSAAGYVLVVRPPRWGADAPRDDARMKEIFAAHASQGLWRWPTRRPSIGDRQL